MLGKTGFVFNILLIVQCFSLDNESPIVISNAGRIRGLRAQDGNYFMFLGIPYATVDTRNPFSSSIPSLLFDEIFDAFDDSYVCPHAHQGNSSAIGTLDCLRLNVYVPEINSIKVKLPVMVWIHGGSFKHGSARQKLYGASYLVQHEVIVVTFNYRVGPYGFMCLDIPEVTGNQGLKDQYIALQWVKDNIEAFGGDPNQITLFGEGAGAHSIDLHLMSNKEVIYNKVILQSGSAQTVSLNHDPDYRAPIKMARYVGYNSADTKDALYYLSNTNIHQVVAAAHKLKIQFKPCIEVLFDDVEPFLGDSWTDANVPNVKNIPVLMGFNKHELARSVFSKNVTHYNTSAIVYDNLNNAFRFIGTLLEELADLVTRFYFLADGSPEQMTWGVINFLSDFIYIHPIHRTLNRYLESGASKIYFYVLTHVGERNAVISTTYMDDEPNSRNCCVSHADELNYIFKKQDLPDLNAADELVMKRITRMWTNFAKYGDPTPEKTSLLPVKWKIVQPKNYYYLNIGANLTLGRRPLHARMAFWDLFYKQNYVHQQGYEDEED